MRTVSRALTACRRCLRWLMTVFTSRSRRTTSRRRACRESTGLYASSSVSTMYSTEDFTWMDESGSGGEKASRSRLKNPFFCRGEGGVTTVSR